MQSEGATEAVPEAAPEAASEAAPEMAEEQTTVKELGDLLAVHEQLLGPSGAASNGGVENVTHKINL